MSPTVAPFRPVVTTPESEMSLERLEGWKQGARTACTLFCMGYQDLVRRIAIIGPDKWKDEGERLTDIYKNAQVRFFQPPGRNAAVAWLKED